MAAGQNGQLGPSALGLVGRESKPETEPVPIPRQNMEARAWVRLLKRSPVS